MGPTVEGVSLYGYRDFNNLETVLRPEEQLLTKWEKVAQECAWHSRTTDHMHCRFGMRYVL